MISYDRRAPAELLEMLKDGWASSLAKYGGCGAFALDLQLRKNSKSPQQGWASLYVGLTKVLDLHYHPSHRFRLEVHPTWQEFGHWEHAWEDWFHHMEPDEWREVEAYLESVIPGVGSQFTVEGAVQAAVTSFRFNHMAVIDREVAMSFASVEERKQTHSALQQPVLAALPPGPDGENKWWKNHPKSLGGELDLLALDGAGQLIAIEIKPASASGTIPWAPVQVRHYANLIRKWVSEVGDSTAAEIIDGMVEQRRQLGLIRTDTPPCHTPIKVRPVVAIQRGASPEVRRRLNVVRQWLEEHGVNDPPLEVYEVNLIGRLDAMPE